MFEEFRKGIVDLTLDKTEKLKLENKNKQKKIDELESTKNQIAELKARMDSITELMKRVPTS